MGPITHPPRPCLTSRVGISGHRRNKLQGPALARIAQQLAEVFAVIDAAARDILAESCEFYASGPHAVRLVCGFAEGADQLAVAASPPDWRVEAILPFGKDEYLNDLAALVREPRREETAEMLIATARILSEDVAAWQQLYGRKRLTLPA